jgi:anaerobic C4-dicarboxylate transporter DcuB
MFWIQLGLLLVIIYFGIRFGGVALGLLGGLGVTILVFVFRLVPGTPPVDVMLIILAVVTTSSTLEATGALGLIVRLAEKLLRRHPEYVVYLAPLCTFCLTMLVGTGHAVYPLLPVIYDVAYRKGIRPERAMGIASVASQMGITASPISAATAATIGIAARAGVHLNLIDIVRITIPSLFLGMLIAATWSLKRGKDLSEDPEFQAKMRDPKMREYIEGETTTTLDQPITRDAKVALGLFIASIATIVLIAIFPDKVLPVDAKGKSVSMTVVLQFVMFAAGAIILFCTKVKAKSISDTKVFNAGMIAVIMIFGIAWMSDTVIESNRDYIISLISDTVKAFPWTFAFAMFAFSAFLKSQAATLSVILPLGFALKVPIDTLIACIPASYAYFFFCFYPSDLAAINFDRSGTTHIGKWILNHSFMIPGLLGVWSAVGVAYILSHFIFPVG